MGWNMEKHHDKHINNFRRLTVQKCFCQFFFCLVFPFAIHGSETDTIRSVFNKEFLVAESNPKAFQFFLGGHLYGDGGHQASVYPSPSILGNIDTINNTGASLFISLGDNVRLSNKIQWSNFKRSFTEKLQMPFFTVLGNHDTLKNPEMCLKLFGPSFYTFRYQNNAFVFIDTIVDEGRLTGEQLDWLDTTLEACLKDEVSNVFLLGHMVIWQDDLTDSDFKVQNGYESSFNYKEDILPALKKLREKEIGVFVFSDDIGGGKDNPNFIFHHEDKTDGIQYMSTGIGNNKNDALIQAFVDENNKVRFEAFSLTGKMLPEIEQFDIAYWEKNLQYRGLSNKLKKRLYNHNFRLGAIVCFGLIFSLVLFWRLIFVIKRVRHGKR